jgi:hypothetical protein
VADFLWISFSTLRATHGEASVEARGTTLLVPAFLIGPVVIWGLTERIVTGFVDLLDTPIK